uniref:VP2 protein n=1 Tax=Calla Lily Valley virus TaxID=3139873 RepID=A0AAN0LKA4_9VIRU
MAIKETTKKTDSKNSEEEAKTTDKNDGESKAAVDEDGRGNVGLHFSQPIPRPEPDTNFVKQLLALSPGIGAALNVRERDYAALIKEDTVPALRLTTLPIKEGVKLLNDIPHILRLRFRQAAATHPYYAHSRPEQMYDKFPFMKDMVDAVPETIESIYLSLDTSNQGFDLKFDPLEDEFPTLSGGGVSDDTLTSVLGKNLAVEVEDRWTAKVWALGMSCFLLAMDFGKFVLFGGSGGVKKTEMAKKLNDRLAKMENRTIFYGDVAKYPHILEAITVTHPLLWFRDEVHDSIRDVPFGATREVERMVHHKLIEGAWVNVDGITAMANRNYLEDHRTMLTRRDDVLAVLNACQLTREDFGDLSDHASFYFLYDERRDSTYELYTLHATPITQGTWDAFLMAMAMSQPFLSSLYEHFRDQVLSRLKGTLFISPPSTALYGIVGPSNALGLVGSTGPNALTVLTNRLSLYGLDKLAGLLAMEFFPQYSNFQTIRTQYAAVDALNFAIDLLGLTTMFSLFPMIFHCNQHVKARYIHDFLLNYFRQDYQRYVGRGVGRHDQGQVETKFRNIARCECTTNIFHLLRPEDIRLQGQGGRMIQDILHLFNEDLSREYTVERGGYQLETRRFRVPVEPHMATGGVVNPLRLDTKYQTAMSIAEQYLQIYGRRGRGINESGVGVYKCIFDQFLRYCRAFSELVHYVIAPIMLGVGREPCCPFSSSMTDLDWRAFPGIIEDVERARAAGFGHPPHTQPSFQTIEPAVCGELPTAGNMFTLLISMIGPGTSYRHGVTVDAEPDYAHFNELLWNNLDLEGRFDWISDRHDDALRIMESFRLAAKVAKGTWMDDYPIFKDLLAERATSIGLKSYSYKALVKIFGQDTSQFRTGWLRGMSGNFGQTREMRIYYPLLCNVVNFERVGEPQPIHHHLVRPYVKKNARLLLGLLFDEQKGMVMYRVGAILSHRFIRGLDFSSVHRLEMIIVRFCVHAQKTVDPEKGNCITTYSGTMSRLGESRNFVIASIPDFQDHLREMADGATRATVQLVKPEAYDADVRSFIRELVENRVVDIVLPRHRFILMHSVVAPAAVTATIAGRDMAQFDKLTNGNIWRIHPLMVMDSSQVVGQLLPGSVIKPLLPMRSSTFEYASTGITAYDQRGGGKRLDVTQFFRPYDAPDNGIGAAPTPVISDTVLEETPHLLRTLMPIYYFDPTKKPFSLAKTTIDDVVNV